MFINICSLENILVETSGLAGLIPIRLYNSVTLIPILIYLAKLSLNIYEKNPGKELR